MGEIENLKLFYIYIKNYKNLQNKSFYLKDQFEVKFKNDFISITKKDNINLYPMNVNLITFIGKNGSGKSSLIEIMLLILMGIEKESFLLFYEGDKFYSTKKLKSNNRLIHLSNEQLKELYSLYFNFTIDTLSPSFYNKILDSKYKINKLFSENRYNNLFMFPNKKFRKIYIERIFKDLSVDYFVVKRYFNFDDNKIKNLIVDIFSDYNFVFFPKEFRLDIDKSKFIYDIEGFCNQINKDFSLSEIYDYFKRENFDLFNFKYDDIETIKKKILLIGMIYLCSATKFDFEIECKICELLYILGKYKKVNRYPLGRINGEFYENKQEIIRQIIHIIKNDFWKIENKLEYFNYENYFYNNIWYIKNTINYLKFVIREKKGITFFQNKYHRYTEELSKSFFEKLPPFILIDLKDEVNRTFLDLSFGEKLLNVLIFKILSVLSNRNEKNINIIYDEFDIGMHPELQRRFINFIVELTKFFKNRNFNIMLSTHSPFILSDIPKENVIFLENGKQVNKFDEEENTFGANIYDIFDKGFFLENSIGKYSEEWIKAIDLILSFYNAYKLAEEDKNIFPLRNLLNKWYFSKNGELTNEEMYQQNEKLLSEKKVTLLRELFEKNDIKYEKFKFLIDDEYNLKPEIKKYIEIIGDEVVRNHLFNLYESLKNENK